MGTVGVAHGGPAVRFELVALHVEVTRSGTDFIPCWSLHLCAALTEIAVELER